MATVTVDVEVYPYDGAVGLVVEQSTPYGWVEVLDTASIGTYPDYTSSYSVTVYNDSLTFRYRWQTGTNSYSEWLSPESVPVSATPEIEARLTQAILAKSVRIYALAESPLGTHGEMTEYGMARVMPDYQIIELLAGLLRVNWDVDPTALVTVADVVREIGYDDLPAAKDADIQRAIDSAASWVAEYVLGGVAIA